MTLYQKLQLIQFVSFNNNPGGDFDVGDLFEVFSCTIKINHSFMDPHFEFVECICSITAWGFSGSDSQNLCGHSPWSSNGKIGGFLSVFSSFDDGVCDFLNSFHVSVCDGESEV